MASRKAQAEAERLTTRARALPGAVYFAPDTSTHVRVAVRDVDAILTELERRRSLMDALGHFVEEVLDEREGS